MTLRATSCRTCRFFEPEQAGPVAQPTGRCHAEPPQRAVVLMPAGKQGLRLQETCSFPLVQPHHWCGKYAPAIIANMGSTAA